MNSLQTCKITAYDYTLQRWLHGEAAIRALIDQLTVELSVLTGVDRLAYAKFAGLTADGLAEAERNVRQKLRELGAV